MEFRRDILNTKLARMSASALNQRNRFVTPQESSYLTTVLRDYKHKIPVFTFSFLSANVSSAEYNKIFDNIYLDYSIMMEDLVILYKQFHSIVELIKNKYVYPRIRLKKSIRQVKTFIENNKDKRSYNWIQELYMTNAINHNTSRNAMVIDNTSGLMRLNDYSEKRYSQENNLDIDHHLISFNSQIVETSDMNNLFDPDMIFYMGIKTKHARNPDIYDYDGIILSLDFVLPSSTPINTLRLRLVSDELEDILDIYYSDSIYGGLGTKITNLRTVNEGFMYEIEFDTVNAKVIHIVFGTKIFKEYDTYTELPGKDNPNMMRDIENTMRNYQINSLAGYALPSDAQITKDIHNASHLPNTIIEPGQRLYMFGIRSAELLYRQYETYGIYQSESTKIEGNLAYVNSKISGIYSNVISTNIQILINGKEYSIGDLDTNGMLEQVAIISINDISSDDKMYKFSTNFLVDHSDLTNRPFIIELNNTVIYDSDAGPTDLISSFEDTEITPTGEQFYVRNNSVISDGTVINLKYYPPAYDRAGVSYSPEYLDIIRSIGKPNVNNYLYANMKSDIYISMMKLIIYVFIIWMKYKSKMMYYIFQVLMVKVI